MSVAQPSQRQYRSVAMGAHLHVQRTEIRFQKDLSVLAAAGARGRCLRTEIATIWFKLFSKTLTRVARALVMDALNYETVQ